MDETGESGTEWRDLAERGMRFAGLLLTTPGVELLPSERATWERNLADYERLLAGDTGSRWSGSDGR